MLDELRLFWDFFFYPLTVLDSMDYVSSILLLSFVCLAVFRFIGLVYDFILDL